MKNNARAVVIGGGVVGVSTLYHLARKGWDDVVLIERKELTSGSTWHAAGGFHSMNADPNVSRLQAYGIGVYKEVEEISGGPGQYRAKIRRQPRFVNNKCTACGDCVEVCPEERPDAFNYGMGTTKAVYLPFEMAYPVQYAIDGETCQGTECGKCVEVCPSGYLDAV